MFNRKKTQSRASAGVSTPRGRAGGATSQPGQNPLARRFSGDAEPDTVELAEPGRFHALPGDGDDEPATRETGGRAVSAGDALVTLDAATGKFYLQPGTDAHPVRLNGVAVEAPTELRRGDRLQVGVHEFEFLA